MKTKLMTAILLSFSNFAFAEGPFGVDIGSDPALLTDCMAGTDDIYKCSTLPKPHSTFSSYELRATPTQGICWIKGVGAPQENDGYGMLSQVLTKSLAGQVAETYGPHTSFNNGRTDETWVRAGAWMMAVMRGDLLYQFVWDQDDGYGPKNRVTRIRIYLDPLGASTGRIMAEFFGENYDNCRKESVGADASAF